MWGIFKRRHSCSLSSSSPQKHVPQVSILCFLPFIWIQRIKIPRNSKYTVLVRVWHLLFFYFHWVLTPEARQRSFCWVCAGFYSFTLAAPAYWFPIAIPVLVPHSSGPFFSHESKYQSWIQMPKLPSFQISMALPVQNSPDLQHPELRLVQTYRNLRNKLELK